VITEGTSENHFVFIELGNIVETIDHSARRCSRRFVFRVEPRRRRFLAIEHYALQVSGPLDVRQARRQASQRLGHVLERRPVLFERRRHLGHGASERVTAVGIELLEEGFLDSDTHQLIDHSLAAVAGTQMTPQRHSRARD